MTREELIEFGNFIDEDSCLLGTGYVEHIADAYLKYKQTDVNNLNLPVGSNSLPDRFWFDDEHGHKVTVIGYIKEWVVVEDIHHEEPYCLPFAYVQAIHDKMVEEGNDC